MNIHEYQAKDLLAARGIAVPAGHAALTVEEAVAAAKSLPGPLYVVKAQIHAGGRGKGKFKELPADAKGGVRLAKSLDEVEAAAREMLGNTLVTIQTGEAGKQVNRLYVTDGVDIAEEYYFSLLVDRGSGRIAMVVSTEGGMNIEDVAHDTPEKITTILVDPAQGFMPHHGRAVAFALKLTGNANKAAQKLSKQLYDAFVALDGEMLEINPLVETTGGDLLVLDAKMSFDFERAVSPPRRRGAARRDRGGSGRGRGIEVRSRLYQAGWRHRLHGQRRGPGDGDDGHHQAERRVPGQLPRCRRRREQGKGHRGVQDHPRAIRR